MALMPCPECGTEVSTEAAACPKCGYHRTVPLSWMDRLFINVGSVAGVLGLAILALALVLMVYVAARILIS